MSDRIKFNKIDWDELILGALLVIAPITLIVGLLVGGAFGLAVAVGVWLSAGFTALCVSIGAKAMVRSVKDI